MVAPNASHGSGRIGRDQRWSQDHPCPICQGHDRMPRGQGIRCTGFRSGDGEYAHCSREEDAGNLPMNPVSETYAHKLTGDCRCGKRHDPNPPPSPRPLRAVPKPRVSARYDYRNDRGEVVYQIERTDPKSFRARRPDTGNPAGWVWNLDGVEPLPYRLPEVLRADPDAAIFIVEGEKDADRLHGRGMVATCNHGGAGKWRDTFAAYFADRRVVILPDNDAPGKRHAENVAAALSGIAASVRVLELPDLPEHGDVSDWFERGGKAEDLRRLADIAPEWSPPALPPPDQVGPLPIVRAGDLAVRAPDWLVKGIAPAESLIVLYGDPGTLKSFIALDLLAALLTGRDWAGRSVKGGAVLYVAAEGQGGIKRRLRAWEKVNGGDLSEMLILPQAVYLDDPAGVADLIATVRALGIALRAIVIDTVARNMTGDEDKTPAMGSFVAACDQLRSETGAAIILVHHTNKMGEMRGNSALRGAADTVIRAARTGEKEERRGVKLTCEKMKDGDEFAPLTFSAHVAELGTDEDGDPITSLVLRPAPSDQVGPPASAPARLTQKQQQAINALRNLGGRASASMWQKASELSSSTFYNVIEQAPIKAITRRETNGRGTVYVLTPTPTPTPIPLQLE